jgi:hypothetical protein
MGTGPRVFLWGSKQGHRLLLRCVLQEAHTAFKPLELVRVLRILGADRPEIGGLATLEASEVLVEQGYRGF